MTQPIPATKLIASYCRSVRGACGFVLVDNPEIDMVYGRSHGNREFHFEGATLDNAHGVVALRTRGSALVMGSEGKGLSRLVTENCDAVVSIPISATTESLNAGIAASVTLYEISKLRAAAKKK